MRRLLTGGAVALLLAGCSGGGSSASSSSASTSAVPATSAASATATTAPTPLAQADAVYRRQVAEVVRALGATAAVKPDVTSDACGAGATSRTYAASVEKPLDGRHWPAVAAKVGAYLTGQGYSHKLVRIRGAEENEADWVDPVSGARVRVGGDQYVGTVLVMTACHPS